MNSSGEESGELPELSDDYLSDAVWPESDGVDWAAYEQEMRPYLNPSRRPRRRWRQLLYVGVMAAVSGATLALAVYTIQVDPDPYLIVLYLVMAFASGAVAASACFDPVE